MKVLLHALVCLCSIASACSSAPEKSSLLRAMEKEINDGDIAGGIVVVGSAEGIDQMVCGGLADIGKKRQVQQDDLFWIASMTKPITACAVMKLQEMGKLQLDDPVAKHLPEFLALKDAAGNPATVTIGQCLSHSSGLSEVPRDQEASLTSLADLTKMVASRPLVYPPGSKWQYCQSSINTAARVVEVVSGMPFVDFLQTHFFDPLEMKDTTFYPNEEQAARLATSYRREKGVMQATPLGFLGGKSATDRTRYPRANGGLFSTAKDYGNFAQMMLGGGVWRGKRILSEASVKQMTSLQTKELATGFTPGNGWGWGWCLVREPQGVSATLSAGSYGHGGAYGTQCWIDPVRGRYFLLLVQRVDFPNSDGSGTRQRLQEAAFSPTK
jgi:CubicO group peptidase (beta-lactamase class C family)